MNAKSLLEEAARLLSDASKTNEAILLALEKHKAEIPRMDHALGGAVVTMWKRRYNEFRESYAKYAKKEVIKAVKKESS